MNVRQTIVYWAVFVLLGGYYWAVERRPAPKAEVEGTREKVVPVFADDVKSLTYRREGLKIRCERRDKRWQIVDPPGASAPADLVSTLVDTLTEKQESDVMSEQPKPEELTAFGMLADAPTLEFELSDGRVITLRLGAKNPTRTAVYAQTNLSPRILMVGLNIQYYGDLLFEAGKNAAKQSAHK